MQLQLRHGEHFARRRHFGDVDNGNGSGSSAIRALAIMEIPSATARAGARLLGDVEEANLEEILIAFRTALGTEASSSKAKHPKAYPIPGLDILVNRNFRETRSAPLAVTGRHLPLIYSLISTLVSPPHNKTVLVLDTEHRFDATRLVCGPDNIRHVYVHRPARRGIPEQHGVSSAGMGPDQARELVAAAENWMLYGDHTSGSRELWGTVVIGAIGAGDVTAAWKGWLRIDRHSVPGFSLGCSAEEAIADRQRRQDAVDAAPWAASSQWGTFSFAEPGASASIDLTDVAN